MKVSRRMTITAGVAGALALVFPAMAQAIKLDMHESFGPTNISSLAAADFARLVKEKTKGNVEISIHYSGSLGIAERDLLTSVEQGVVPLASTILDKLLTTLPVAAVQFVPFLAGDHATGTALFSAIKPHIEEQLSRESQILLFETIGMPVGLWSKKPAQDLATLKTFKIRTNNPNTTKTFQNAGTSPTFMAWSDVPPALATGVIDSVVTTDESGVVARLYEQLPHYTRLNIEIGWWLVHMHKPTFDKLAPEFKTAIMEAAAEARKTAYTRVGPRLEENTKTMKANGVTVHDTISAEFRQQLEAAGRPLLDDWKKKIGSAKAEQILADFEKAKQHRTH